VAASKIVFDKYRWRRAELDALKHVALKTSRAWAIEQAPRGLWHYL